jgi:hypothetical protein
VVSGFVLHESLFVAEFQQFQFSGEDSHMKEPPRKPTLIDVSFVNDGGLVSRGRSPMRLLGDSSKETGSDHDLRYCYPERVTFYSKAGEPLHAVVHIIAAHVQ